MGDRGGGELKLTEMYKEIEDNYALVTASTARGKTRNKAPHTFLRFFLAPAPLPLSSPPVDSPTPSSSPYPSP